MKIEQTIIYLIAIIFEYTFYIYLKRLTDCECSSSDGLSEMITSTFINVIIIIGRMIFTSSVPPPIIVTIFFIHYHFVSAVQTYLYLKSLKDAKCECSKSTSREFFYYYHIAMGCLFGILLALIYVALLIHLY